MMHHVHAMICLLFSSQNHVPTPIDTFSKDAQYSKHFQRSGECSYVFLEWIATYIHREGKTKINFFTSFFFWSILALTLLYLFATRIYFEREQYRNPVLNSITYLYIYIYDIFPTGTRYFLLKLLLFFFRTSSFTVKFNISCNNSTLFLQCCISTSL